MLHAVFIGSPIALYIVQDGCFQLVTPAFQRILGYSEDELLGASSLQFVHPDDRDTVRERAIKMLKGQRFSGYEFRCVSKSGEVKWAMETVTSVQYHGKRAILGNFVDITERKRTEAQITRLNTLLKTLRNVNQLITREKNRQSLIQNSCDLMVETRGYALAWILLIDKAGNHLATAYAGEEKLSLLIEATKRDEYPQCVREVLAGESSFINYVDVGQHQGCALRDACTAGGSFIARLEYGGKVYGTTLISVPAGIVPDLEEQKLFLELANDIAFALATMETEEARRQAAEALWVSERNFRNSLDGSPLGVRIADADGNTLYANRAVLDIYGYSSVEELEATPVSQRYTPESYAGHLERQEKKRKGEPVPGNYELNIIRKDGEIRQLEVFCKDVLWGGKPQIMVMYHDITERRRMQEQLMLADRLASIGELASGVAHEVNNPLTSVLGFSQLLLQRDLPHDVREDVKTIYDEAERASRAAKNLLTFARKHAEVKEPVNINNLIETVLALRTYEQKVNNIQVDTHFAPDLPQVMADAFQLQQAFLNIILNAEYFMLEAHSGGTLTITTERVGNIVRAAFADDGPGIPKENLRRLFDPFFTTKPVGKGSGLGLSICHGIVTSHGGRIYAESEFSKGATFIVELPVS